MSMPLSRLPRRRPAAILAGALTVAGAAVGCGVLADDPAPPPVVVAADLALTSTGSATGEVLRRGLELRVEQINRQGLADGRRVELRVRDNRSDPRTAARNIAEFAADPDVNAVVTGGCGACVVEAAADIDAAGVPTVALAPGDAVAAPAADRRFLFQLAPPAGDTADLLAAELSRAGVRGFALVTVDDGGGYAADGARELAAAAAASGLDLLVHERLRRDPATTTDTELFAAVAARTAGWRPEPAPFPGPGTEPDPGAVPGGPEAVVLWASSGEAGALAVALRDAGWSGQFFLAAAAAGGLFLTGPVAEALTGARLVFTETLAIDQVIATSPARTARQQWWRDYLARYGGYDAYASFAADSVDLVVAALDRTSGTDRERLRDSIAATRLDGLSGPIRFTPDDHSGLQPLALTVLVAAGDRWRPAG